MSNPCDVPPYQSRPAMRIPEFRKNVERIKLGPGFAKSVARPTMTRMTGPVPSAIR